MKSCHIFNEVVRSDACFLMAFEPHSHKSILRKGSKIISGRKPQGSKIVNGRKSCQVGAGSRIVENSTDSMPTNSTPRMPVSGTR